jgi:GH15 family glucan-1,4-alpha-glucosidase
MPKEIVIGNGRMIVAIDNRMRIRDFFYPHVGLENHLLGHEFKTGIWANGKFMWLGDNWEITMKYMPETLVSKCFAGNKEFQLELDINDAVHNFLDLYLRKVAVNNVSDSKREVRLFFSHDFHIYGEDAGDTVLYEPTLSSIIHYKRKRYFLINGITEQNEGIYQFAAGYKESFGKEGTWKDAEDGVLEGNPIAQGSVDSVVSFKLEMQPKSVNNIYYWIACGKNLNEVKNLDSKVKSIGVEQMLLETENYWSAWVNKQDADLSILPRDIIRMFKASLLIMRTHIDNNGGVIASCDSDVLQFNRDTYSYVWPRDGAIVALAFDMAGFPDVSALFFRFCDRVMTEEGFFRHKYLPDGSIGSSWHSLIDSKGRLQLPIQEDETALVLYTLWKHFEKYRDLEFIRRVYPNLVIKATEFLLDHRHLETGLPKPSFDPWEERTGIFTSTVATVCAALAAAARFAKVFYDSERQEMLNRAAGRMKEAMLTHLYDRKLGRFIKAIYPDGSRDSTVDNSLSFIFTCGVFDAADEVVENTMNAVVNGLWVKTDVGGVARYENDEYHRVSKEVPGNPWFISTLWLARWYIASANSLEQLRKGLDLLSLTVRRSSPSGVLAEQLNPYTGMPLSVSPLIWSHAEFVIAVCEYVNKYREISSMAIMNS